MNDDDINKVEEAAVKYGKFMDTEAYLEWEFRQGDKHEYISGEIIAMAGASPNHNIIQSNIVGGLWKGLDGKPCVIVGSDLKVYVKSKQSYFYPDAAIIWGDPEYADERNHVVKNPSVIFEILSPSTESYDQGTKFFFYMQVDSINEIIIVSSNAVEIKTGRRQPDNSWKFQIINDLSESLFIEAIDTEISLENVYRKINF